MWLSQLATQMQAPWQGADMELVRVSTDTRTLQPGDFFVALRGEHFDGHSYLSQALAAGAGGAMVEQAQPLDIAQLIVADTRRGLGRLGQLWLAQFSPRKVAITGSSGKTTVKEMVASILSQQGPTVYTQGNFNNEIGVPLTLCRVGPEHQFLVAELGANHLGEIAYTVDLVQPHVALVNNVGEAHLEGFGSRQNIARAKAEIYQGLDTDGVAVINLDDDFADFMLDQTGHCQRCTFSLTDSAADLVVQSVTFNDAGQAQFSARVGGASVVVKLAVIGKHNVANALAAMAIAHGLGCSPGHMAAGLAAVKAVPGRLRVVEELAGYQVIDDSYNANPGSVRSAIDVLASLQRPTCLVLGDMAELGPQSPQLHRAVGEYAGRRNIDVVYGLGRNAEQYRQGYLQSKPQGEFVTAVDHSGLARDLLTRQQDKTILLKGSRSAAMEKVIAHMLQSATSQGSVN
ncbi:MAG: UDP-N-acetylmuramoyl-tripeptide--D-alanyl-D-alanine ligase [Pseudomonadota bacterium]|nr:UDP-N-acetylmuramoyl-tripeptide--D-alanyl-D-alanine ligase [Pseudomonadales bacterium]MDY6918910.1 UDP-N-acetylmuramoyl-tripeptide--D-alanyl-D-alanine ligase [Pseudomonadota bacterium]